MSEHSLMLIKIIEGIREENYLFIAPLKYVRKTKENPEGIEMIIPEGISIEHDIAWEFLSYFLTKYFDPNYPYKELRDESKDIKFAWNTEYNIYTIESIKNMINEIDRCINLLKFDYANKELSEIKKYFSTYTFWSDEEDLKNIHNIDERNHIIKKNKFIAITFYEDFSSKMKRMVDNASNYNFIGVVGP